MAIPTDNHRFYLKNLKHLRSEIERLALNIPVDEDLSPLCEHLEIGGKSVPNRFCVQPMEGHDAQPDGTPGDLTFRRYKRYARGGFGLIWLEATAVAMEARSSGVQLCLHEHNVEVFANLVTAIRKTARDGFDSDVVVFLQLAHTGRRSSPQPNLTQRIAEECPSVTDDYLDELQDRYVAVAKLASEAGFDGVDVKSCHGDLLAELHSAFAGTGRYGGSLENRTRFLRETLGRIGKDVPGILPTTRMSAYDALPYPHGFGVDKEDFRTPDLAEPVELVRMLKEAGVPILSVSTGCASLSTDVGKPSDSPGETSGKKEHPLVVLDRIMGITRRIQEAFPELPIVGGSYSWLRQFMPHVGSGAVRSGGAAIIGIGRGALAYPDAVRDVLATGQMDAGKCCISCSACIQLMRDGGATGCVIKDSDTYGPEYRRRRHFAPDHLIAEARRCHGCEAAPCSTGCPAGIDVPAFIRAFADNDIETAFAVIRQSNVLPEMCSHLCPAWLQCEGCCIETTLTGKPVPIRDIQYVVCWLARERGISAISLQESPTGRKAAIVGGGPTGVACAVKLLERGHSVTIIERATRLGGTPDSVIPADRFTEAQTEIGEILQPAIDAGILHLNLGRELGADTTLAELRAQYDAVLLAAGLCRELSLGKAEGAVDALTFLKQAKSGELKRVPGRIAILSGGDSAMDAALTAGKLGAVDLYVVYGGSFSEMHWHMPDDWFTTSGAHLLDLTRPLGYELDESGRLAGIKIGTTEYGPRDASGTRHLQLVPGTERLLNVDMVIEAMGLRVSDGLQDALEGIVFTEDGLIRTVGEDSFATGLDGVFAAGALINGGATVAQCVAEGMRAAEEINRMLS